MQKVQIVELLLLISVEFPNEINTENKKAFDMKCDLWYKSLGQYEFGLVKQAVVNVLTTQHFCPKLADVVTEIDKLHELSLPTAEQTWTVVERALREADEHIYSFQFTAIVEGTNLTLGEVSRIEAKKVYENLPIEAQDFFGGYSSFAKVARQQSEWGYEKGRFLKSFQRIRDRLKKLAATPPEILQLAEQSEKTEKARLPGGTEGRLRQ